MVIVFKLGSNINFLPTRSHDPYEVSMNFLMTMALEKIAYLPFAFMVDQVRKTFFPRSQLKKTARN